jgi:hypothetical protein
MDWANGEQLGSLPAMAGLQCVALSPDRKRVATASWSGSIQLWDLSTQTEIARAEGSWSSVSACRFTKTGDQLLVLADAASLSVWDYRRELDALAAAAEHPGVTIAAALSCGVGVLGADESEDFLFAAAPRDLATRLSQILEPARRALVTRTSTSLRSPRPAACFLAPSAREQVLVHPLAEGG